MRQLSRSRLRQLERQMNLDAPPIGRLFVLIPDLWPEADREAFSDPEREEALEDLVERRTGVRPVRDPHRIWAIIHHMPEEARDWDDATKAAYLEEHETRPLPLWLRRERACG
jgi:hypothetical protein